MALISQADIVPLLKVAPLVLATVLTLVSLGFRNSWINLVRYFLDDDEINSDYEHYTVYIFDQLETKYSLIIAFFYSAVILLLTFLEPLTTPSQEFDYLLLLFALAFFGLAILSCPIVNRWYNPTTRTPSAYYKYYYHGRNDPDIKENFENTILSKFKLSKVDRIISPKRLAFVTEVVLIVHILGVEYPSLPQTLIVAGTGGIIVLLGALTFPGKTVYTILGIGVDWEQFRERDEPETHRDGAED